MQVTLPPAERIDVDHTKRKEWLAEFKPHYFSVFFGSHHKTFFARLRRGIAVRTIRDLFPSAPNSARLRGGHEFGCSNMVGFQRA